MSAAAKLKSVDERVPAAGEGLVAALVEQLRELKATVVELGIPGAPTLLVGYGRRNTLLDVGAGSSSAPFRNDWQGAKVRSASTLNEACAALGLRLMVRQSRNRKASPKRTGRTKSARGGAARGPKR